MLESAQVKQCTICWEWKSVNQMVYTKHGKYTHYMCRDCINYLKRAMKEEKTYAGKQENNKES